jgi:hypothetical protein
LTILLISKLNLGRAYPSEKFVTTHKNTTTWNFNLCYSLRAGFKTEMWKVICFVGRRHCLGGIVSRLRAGRFGVQIPAGANIFLVSKTFTGSLWPIQPPIQWVPEFFHRDKAAGT